MTQEEIYGKDEHLRQTFARTLSYHLALKGYNQADLARRLQVSTATTAKWCTGQTMPRIDKIQAICNWLGIDKATLLGEADEPAKAGYYTDPETARVAQEIFENKELKALFDVQKDLSADDLRAIHQMALALKRKEQNE